MPAPNDIQYPAGYQSTLIALSNDDLLVFQNGFSSVLLGIPLIFEFRVVDTLSNPIANATLTFTNPDNSDTYSITTDSNGIGYAEPFSNYIIDGNGLIQFVNFRNLTVVASANTYLSSSPLTINPNSTTIPISYTIVLVREPILINTEVVSCAENILITPPTGFTLHKIFVNNVDIGALDSPTSHMLMLGLPLESKNIRVDVKAI